jgi:hypothetical protein
MGALITRFNRTRISSRFSDAADRVVDCGNVRYRSLSAGLSNQTIIRVKRITYSCWAIDITCSGCDYKIPIAFHGIVLDLCKRHRVCAIGIFIGSILSGRLNMDLVFTTGLA